MSYLIRQDLLKSVQSLNLDQITGSNYDIINSWMQSAVAKATSYLTQKYACELEFTDTNKWLYNQTYNAGDRVYLDAAVYDPTATYTVGQYTVYSGNFYIATAISTAIAFNGANWTLINPQYTIYYAFLPYPAYNINTFYNVGNQVYYNGLVYTALQPSATYSPTYILQIGLPVPPINYAPGTAGYNQWDAGVAYIVPALTAITDTTYWMQGDNRSQEMVKVIIDIVLFYAHTRISPMNIPDLRKDNYREAINWLKEAGDGLVTPALPRRMPNQGNKIRYGQVRSIASFDY